ncbi:MAG: sulfite exporter TauE/SafE family protein [Thermodesulfobacteriota bacterium]
MRFLTKAGQFLYAGAQAHAEWEISTARTILSDKRRLLVLVLMLLPILIGGVVFADDIAGGLPGYLGGKTAYSPSFFTMKVFIASILIGLCAGLITGCIGAGGGFIIAPALMSAGIKGILAVGTDLFHIFAKAIMGSVLHKKLGNISVSLAVIFLIGSIGGASLGGWINRVLYELNPVISDAFITTIYVLMLGALGLYSLLDFLKARKAEGGGDFHGGKDEGTDMGNLPKKLQAMNLPPMVTFDQGLIPGGRRISSWFLIASGFFVGLAAAIMGVGGGFLTFPIFVYVLGVSSMTTVGTDIFQIIFTAGYAAIGQYAIYGFIFYTLAMGMLLGSLVGIQIGAMTTKVVKGITIRGFYAMAVLAGFINRFFALPSKLSSVGWFPLSKETAAILDKLGIWLFFVFITIFAVWVIGTFVLNIKKLRGKEA